MALMWHHCNDTSKYGYVAFGRARLVPSRGMMPGENTSQVAGWAKLGPSRGMMPDENISQVADLIEFVGQVGALSLGIPGNLLIIVVMTRPRMCTCSAYVYFLLMAVCDIVSVSVLGGGILADWDILVIGQSSSTWACRVAAVVVRTFYLSSVWLMAALAVDRLLAVRYPFKAMVICTTKRALLIATFIVSSMFVLQLPMAWALGEQTLQVGDLNVTINCGASSPAARHYLDHVAIIVVICVTIPVTASVGLNAALIKALIGRQRWVGLNRQVSTCEDELANTKPLTHLPLGKMAAISQTIFSDAFSWMKSFVFWLKFQ